MSRRMKKFRPEQFQARWLHLAARKLRQTIAPLAAGLSIFAALPAGAATMFMGAYPDSLIVVDEGKGGVTERIKLGTGLPTSIRLSNDRKRIYVTTITTSGIEILDSATHKIINQFSLNTPTRRYRFNSGAPDPSGRYFYTVLQEMDKGLDRYTVGKPKYAVIDLQLKKVVRTAEVAAEDEAPGGGVGRGN
jgi:DNA-binding beta-propeller fold protein YncE